LRSIGVSQPTNPFQNEFKEYQAILTDSGRSALAVVIKGLNLQNKTIILPAYTCDAVFPVLQTYNIKPIFIDVDEKTYQPPLRAYTDKLLRTADAVILVATYGASPDQAVIERLKVYKKVIIEDYAMCNPLHPVPLIGAARIYSLPKTMPVPDGGLAIMAKSNLVPYIAPHRFSLGFAKNVLKLLPGIGPLIAKLRNWLKDTQTKPTWDKIKQPSNLTKNILQKWCQSAPANTDTTYLYCHPMTVTDPNLAVASLHSVGISAEKIWHQPIIMNHDVQAAYELSPTQFPATVKLAKTIVCAPLWHITDEASYHNYLSKLKKILANLSS